MIQSLIPGPIATPATPLDALLAITTSTAGTLDFGALLAQRAVPVVASQVATSAPLALPAAIAEAATLAAPAAETGNPLPPPLPDLAAPLPLPVNLAQGPITSSAEAASMLQTQLQAAPPTRPVRAAKVGQAAPRPQTVRAAAKPNTAPRETEPTAPIALPQPGEPDRVAKFSVELLEPQPLSQQQPDQPASAAPSSTLASVAPAVPELAVPAATPAPAHQDGQAEPSPAVDPRQRPAVPATSDPAPQAVAHAAPQAAFLRAVITPVTPQPDQPVAQPDAPQQAVRAPGLLRVEIAMPGAAEPAVKALEKAPPAPRRTMATGTMSAAHVLSAADGSLPQPVIALSAPAFAASPRPHDFAALVERLVAAREAVQPQGATLTVAHAEFGPVELRFRHEARGLAVSLASADPDFARAAAAAPPVSLPVSTATFVAAEPSQSAPSRDGAASPGGTASGQSRGQQSERRDEGAQQSNQSPHRAAARNTARRSGIFA